MKETISLSRNRHDRDSAGLTYIYPVLSRRAGGISIGINLNTNNACNWRCIYCQVPNLQRGAAPEINLELFKKELTNYLNYAAQNQFIFYDDEGKAWPVVDICFSGNGEPTASPQFAAAADILLQCLSALNLLNKFNLVVISNGSEIYKLAVQHALGQLAKYRGELWFKIDAGSEVDWQRINQTHLNTERVLKHLTSSVNAIVTKIQTCVFSINAGQIDIEWEQNYLAFLAEIKARKIEVAEVLLYSVARSPQLIEGAHITAINVEALNLLAQQVEQLGFSAKAFQS